MQAQAPDWSGPVNKNLEPGSVNTNWGPGQVNTNWGPGPVNTNWGPGAKQRSGGREIQIPDTSNYEKVNIDSMELHTEKIKAVINNY